MNRHKSSSKVANPYNVQLPFLPSLFHTTQPPNLQFASNFCRKSSAIRIYACPWHFDRCGGHSDAGCNRHYSDSEDEIQIFAE